MVLQLWSRKGVSALGPLRLTFSRKVQKCIPAAFMAKMLKAEGLGTLSLENTLFSPG